MSTVIGTVTIARNPSIETRWWPERVNQTSQTTADGKRKTYDNGVTVYRGVLVINNLTATEKSDLQTYLNGTAVYGKTAFSIDPPVGCDLGGGDGAAVTAFYDGGPTLDGVFTRSTNGILYNLNLPYFIEAA